MAVESDADRLAFLDADEFGVEATYSGQTISGILLDAHEAAEYGARVPVESADYIFACRASDVSGVAHGDSLTVSGTAYTVRGVEPDGEGMVRLRLADET